MENLFNVNQVAFILKVHPLTIRRYIKEKRLKAIKIAGNIRVKESDLQAFNKEFSPEPPPIKPIKNKLNPAKIFTLDDSFFRLNGRGARLQLSR